MSRVQIALSRFQPTARVPKEFTLFAAGRGHVDEPITGQGPTDWLMDAQAGRAVIAAFKRRGRDIVIDYEHQTFDDSARGSDGTAPAAGWITGLRWVENTGLIAACKWTERGAAFVGNREYRYQSPVFRVDSGDRVCELLHVALTNDPATLRARPIAAKRYHEPLQTPSRYNRKDTTMSLTSLKRIPDDGSGSSPLEQFRDCAMAVMEVLQRRGVALSDRTTANDPAAEQEFAAEVQRTFSESDARALDALCGFVGGYATATERADAAAADAATDDAEIDVAALSREYARSPSLQQEFRRSDTYIAFKRAEARGAVRIHRRI